MSETCSEGHGAPTGTSEKSKHSFHSSEKHPSLASVASKDSSGLTTSDRKISTESGRQQSTERRHSTRSVGGVSSQSENVHRRSSRSVDHSPRSSSGVSRPAKTRHGRISSSSSQLVRSGLHTDPESGKDPSPYHSRRSSSAREHRSGQRQGSKDDADRDARSLERFRRRPERDRDSGRTRVSVFHRIGHRKDSASCRGPREREPRTRSAEKPEEIRQDQPGTSVTKVDQTEARSRREDTQLTKDLDRLSVVSGETSGTKLKEEDEGCTAEYKSVLTRHVNQLFIRGDNVALVAIVG